VKAFSERSVLAAFIASGALACASAGGGRLTSETSAPSPVDPAVDNGGATSQLAQGLLIRVHVVDNAIKDVEATVATIWNRQPRSIEEGHRVMVMGLWQGSEVARRVVPDNGVRVEEHRGIVLATTRTIVLTLPLARRVDTVAVTLPRGVPVPFDVRKTFEDFCVEWKEHPFCR
jgi:hypothetical protein